MPVPLWGYPARKAAEPRSTHILIAVASIECTRRSFFFPLVHANANGSLLAPQQRGVVGVGGSRSSQQGKGAEGRGGAAREGEEEQGREYTDVALPAKKAGEPRLMSVPVLAREWDEEQERERTFTCVGS